MSKFDLKEFNKKGYQVINNVISKKLLNEFNQEINYFLKKYKVSKKIFKDDRFSALFKRFKNRKAAYTLMQDLRSVKLISNEINNLLIKNRVFKKLKYKVPSIKNGLIISLPNENLYDNPLHQDIYNHYSKKYYKIWAPLTQVNNTNGSMRVFEGSHKQGYIKPQYKNLDYYPEIDESYTKNFKETIFDFKPGPIVIFNPFIIHSSVKNISNKTRFVVGCDIQDLVEIPRDSNEKIFKNMEKVSKLRSERRKLINY